MKDILLFWKRRYSAVNTTEGVSKDSEKNVGGDVPVKCFAPGRRMSMEQSIPPIIDSFFYQRKSGEKTRQPKRNLFVFYTDQ